MNVKRKDLQICNLQVIDSKGLILVALDFAKPQMGGRKKKKRELSSRTPNAVIYKVKYTTN
jgi:hypothetical protein